MKIATSRYFANGLISESGLTPLGITVGAPKFPLNYELAGNIGMLAPFGGMRKVTDEQEFVKQYRERLERFGVAKIKRVLACPRSSGPVVPQEPVLVLLLIHVLLNLRQLVDVVEERQRHLRPAEAGLAVPVPMCEDAVAARGPVTASPDQILREVVASLSPRHDVMTRQLARLPPAEWATALTQRPVVERTRRRVDDSRGRLGIRIRVHQAGR
jgi:hypothetical protein